MAGEMANSQINLANSLGKEEALAIIVTPQACGGATRGKQTTLVLAAAMPPRCPGHRDCRKRG